MAVNVWHLSFIQHLFCSRWNIGACFWKCNRARFFFFSPPVLRQSIGSIIAVITWLLALGWFWYIYDIVLWVIKDNEADAKPVSVCEQVSNPEHIREKSLALLYCVAARVIIGCKHDSVCDTEDRCWIFKGTIHPKIKSTCFSSDPLCYLFK